eukprot:1177162-Prorocentrum_minimum.AAC.2
MTLPCQIDVRLRGTQDPAQDTKGGAHNTVLSVVIFTQYHGHSNLLTRRAISIKTQGGDIRSGEAQAQKARFARLLWRRRRI